MERFTEMNNEECDYFDKMAKQFSIQIRHFMSVFGLTGFNVHNHF